MAECDKVCNYIDLPLQHASDAVLKRMKRPGTRAEYDTLLDAHPRRACPASRSAPPSSSASPARPRRTSTSSAAFVGDHAFDHVGVFTYSHEEGTSALRARRRRAGAAQDGAANARDGPAEAAGAGAPAGAGRRARPAAGRRPVGRPRARPAGPAGRPRRPTSTPRVYLTDCDPSASAPGEFVEVEIVGAARLRPDRPPGLDRCESAVEAVL